MCPKIIKDKTSKSSDNDTDVLTNFTSNQLIIIDQQIGSLCDWLNSSNFNVESTFQAFHNFNKSNCRILYSSLSNKIFKYFESKQDYDETIFLFNLDKLLNYSFNKAHDQSFNDTHKIILKFYDHANLAFKQYTMLKITDKEYQDKFEKQIYPIKSKLSKEINAQMLTMLGIFTALAFLVFGSISSLDSIFEKNELPLFKTLSIATVWGICVSNMIFVFLHCAGRMSNLSFSSDGEFKIVKWTNSILFGFLFISLIAYLIEFCYGQDLICFLKDLLSIIINNSKP